MTKNTTPNPDDLLQELLFPKDMWEKPIKHYAQVITITMHHFYIAGEIEADLDRYIDMINTIKTAEEHDQVFLYLNTPGGDMATTIAIIAAIEQCPAHVTTVIEGEVCSAGTLIFLAGHDFIVNNHCSMMIHNYSHGPMGKGGEVRTQVKYSEEYFERLANHFYKDFLTDEEIKGVCEDKDIWMGSEEILERLERAGAIDVPDEEEEAEAEEDDILPASQPRVRKTANKKKTKAPSE